MKLSTPAGPKASSAAVAAANSAKLRSAASGPIRSQILLAGRRARIPGRARRIRRAAASACARSAKPEPANGSSTSTAPLRLQLALARGRRAAWPRPRAAGRASRGRTGRCACPAARRRRAATCSRPSGVWPMPATVFGILDRVAGQHVERERRVAHAAGDRPDHVAVARQRHDAGIRHQREGRLDADERLRRGRVLDRAAGLLGEAEHRHAGRDGASRCRRCCRRAGTRGRRRCRSARPNCRWRGAGVAEHRHVGLAQDDGAGRAHPRHHRRVGAGHQVDAAGLAVEQRPARRGGKAHHVHRVLDHDRHAGQRPERLAGSPARGRSRAHRPAHPD